MPMAALVGAGGKTTTLFQLASELEKPVLLSATTHLALEQTLLADTHYVVNCVDDIHKINFQDLTGTILLTGPDNGKGRTKGLDDACIEAVHMTAETCHLPLLIEADGARCLPFKAPRDHEPPIPAFCDLVVVIAGLSAIGKPLDVEHVYNPDGVAELSDLMPGDLVTAETIARVLSSQSGGLKNIPPQARRVALLNQADTAVLKSAGRQIADSLLKDYDSVVIASLLPDAGLAQSGKTNPLIHAVHEKTAGIVLAAGKSSRAGTSKLNLIWKGEPLFRHAVRAALDAGLDPVILVTGCYHDEIARAAEDLPVEIVFNPEWESGISTSIKTGLKALGSRSGSAIYLLADQPQVSPALLQALAELHASTLSPIVLPVINGSRGNPVLFDRSTFSAAMALEGDTGGRQLFSKFASKQLVWHDASILFDVDTLDDYNRLISR